MLVDVSEIADSILSRLATRAFAPRPKVHQEGALLVIESDWRTAALTLGGRKRRVSIDARNRILRIQDRTFWAITKNQVIAFDRVKEIIYTYSDIMDSNWISHTEEDLYRVGLWLVDGKEIILFRFYGQGEFVNNSIFPDWMYLEEIIPGKVVTHDMEHHSISLADMLSTVIGVPIGSGPL